MRLNRYRRFRELAVSLGIDAYKGVNGALEQDHLANLAQYKQFRCDHLAAIENYLKYLEGDLYNEPMRTQLAAYVEKLGALVKAQRALEKANRLLEGHPSLSGELVPWAQPYLNNGGLPAAPGERPLEWQRAVRLLNRSHVFLAQMPPDQRAGIHARDGRWRLVWIEKEVPSSLEIQRLLRRVRMVLELAASEIARGEDKKEAPKCQR